jgi:hypothetical protein
MPGTSWFTESKVPALLVGHLAKEDWQIRRVASTASREQGVDIEAERHGQDLLVEVKGYPSAQFGRGPKAGQSKIYGAAGQARTYYGSAPLAGLLVREDNQTSPVPLAFPALRTHESLARRTTGVLARTDVEVWLVDEGGKAGSIASC